MQEKNSPEGLVGVARRFVKFGGGVSQVQLAWLEQQLQVRPLMAAVTATSWIMCLMYGGRALADL
jgi:hypothetical protein